MVGTRRVTLRALVVVVALAGLGVSAGAAAGAPSASGGEKVKIIGVFEDSVGNPHAAARDLEARHNGRLSFVYAHALKGFAGEFPQGSLSGLERDPRVDYIELDQIATIAGQDTPTGIDRIFAPGNANLDIDATDDYRVDVDVAVLDTGIDFEHPDLNVNVAGSITCAYGGPYNTSCQSGGDDDQYHGTHVAGTIGALDNGDGVVGVAPGARLWSIKVLNSQGSGYFSWITAGIDYVTAKASEIEVANMSLGCECSSSAASKAITNAVKAGVTFAVAAGNSAKDASTFFPANHPDVITVSALADFNGAAGGGAASTCRTDQDDTLADFSNYGSSVEIAAPGVCIRSTYPIEYGSYGTISGTSMASPHVAGAAALLAVSSTTRPSPNTIRSTLMAEGNSGWTDDKDGHEEPLLDVRDTAVFKPRLTATGQSISGGSNSAPTASFTKSCTDLACSFADTSTDSDGTVASWSWNFGDGSTSTAQHPSHTYAAGGTYTVSLTVTDDDGATATSSQSVTVSAPATGGVSLTATGYKVKGVQHADLTWSGATSTNVDVYRGGSKVATTANDGAYTDNIGNKGGGSYTYKVCEAGTTTCSNETTVAF